MAKFFISLLFIFLTYSTKAFGLEHTISKKISIVGAEESGIIDEIYNFKEDLALVQINAKLGFINKNGLVVIRPVFKEGFGFHNGLALVKKDNKWFYINKKGEIVLESKTLYRSSFSDDLAVIGIKKDNKTVLGYIDKTGNIVIQPIYDEAYSFKEGLALIKVNKKYGFINRKGEIIIPAIYDNMGEFSDNVTYMRINDKYGYIDKKGNFLIHSIYDSASKFSEGLASVKINSKYHYINKKNEIIINHEKLNYFYISDFNDGMSMVLSEDLLYGFINKSGELKIPLDYLDSSSYFSEGLVPVKFKNNKWGYLDKENKIIIEPQYDYASNFLNGIAFVEIDSKKGFINKENKFIWKSKY